MRVVCAIGLASFHSGERAYRCWRKVATPDESVRGRTLKAWLAVREPDADNFVFNSQKSTQMNRVTIFKLFRAIAKKAGLGETLQHTAAMLLVQQGANAFLIRKALGRKSFDST